MFTLNEQPQNELGSLDRHAQHAQRFSLGFFGGVRFEWERRRREDAKAAPLPVPAPIPVVPPNFGHIQGRLLYDPRPRHDFPEPMPAATPAR